MKNIIHTLMQNEEICCIFSDENEQSKFDVGIIVDYDDEFIEFIGVDSDGKNDGYYIRRIDNIFKIETETLYLAKIKKLLAANNECLTAKVSERRGECGVLHFVLRKIMQENKFCTICVCDDYENNISGKVQSFDDYVVTLDAYDTNGNRDGNSYIKISDISFMTYDSNDELKLQKLQ